MSRRRFDTASGARRSSLEEVGAAGSEDAARFLALMALTDRGAGSFGGAASPDKGERVFGGQFLAQGLRAAQRSAGPDRAAHSLHAYFLRPGDAHAEVELAVEGVRDGRSFSVREVRALQSGRELFRMQVSLQVPERSLVYQGSPMPAAPDPEAVSVTYDEFTLAQTGNEDWEGASRPMEIRYVNPPRKREPVTEAQLMWMRIPPGLPDDPALHVAGLAYLSDSTLVDHVMLPHGKRWQDTDFAGASLDHAMWFHRPARADQWLLFEQTVQATGGARGLVHGRFFDRGGNLVASCMQEGLMRLASC